MIGIIKLAIGIWTKILESALTKLFKGDPISGRYFAKFMGDTIRSRSFIKNLKALIISWIE